MTPDKQHCSGEKGDILKCFFLETSGSVLNVLARIVRATRFSCYSLERMIFGLCFWLLESINALEAETLSTDQIFQMFAVGKLKI